MGLVGCCSVVGFGCFIFVWLVFGFGGLLVNAGCVCASLLWFVGVVVLLGFCGWCCSLRVGLVVLVFMLIIWLLLICLIALMTCGFIWVLCY